MHELTDSCLEVRDGQLVRKHIDLNIRFCSQVYVRVYHHETYRTRISGDILHHKPRIAVAGMQCLVEPFVDEREKYRSCTEKLIHFQTLNGGFRFS